MAMFKGFTAGLLTGAAVGGLMGMVLDPMKDKDSKKLKKTAGEIVDSITNTMGDMKN